MICWVLVRSMAYKPSKRSMHSTLRRAHGGAVVSLNRIGTAYHACFNTRILGAEWQHNYSTDDAVTDRPVHRCTIRGDIACLRRQWQAHPAKQHQQFNAGKNSPADMTGRCSRCRQCLAQHQHPNYYCHTGVDNQLQTYATNNMLVVS